MQRPSGSGRLLRVRVQAAAGAGCTGPQGGAGVRVRSRGCGYVEHRLPPPARPVQRARQECTRGQHGKAAVRARVTQGGWGRRVGGGGAIHLEGHSPPHEGPITGGCEGEAPVLSFGLGGGGLSGELTPRAAPWDREVDYSSGLPDGVAWRKLMSFV